MTFSLDLTPHAAARHWSASLIGKAWSPTFTCWDLVRAVQLGQFDRRLPAYDLSDERSPEQLRGVVYSSGWLRADAAQAREGDVLLMRGPDGLHIGVIVAPRGKPELLHNLGGMDNGAARGSVRIDLVEDLGRLGYGRFELWQAAC